MRIVEPIQVCVSNDFFFLPKFFFGLERLRDFERKRKIIAPHFFGLTKFFGQHVSFEENRFDEQNMDDKAEMKLLSDRNDQKIINKQRKDDGDEAAKLKLMDRNKELLESNEGTKRKREVSIRKSKKAKDIKN